ncbi:MAG: hypothetical protein IKG21_01615 [Atopobiaceae bacterium]|nr:hypothetical protein [Atopobiaceae bacterium]
MFATNVTIMHAMGDRRMSLRTVRDAAGETGVEGLKQCVRRLAIVEEPKPERIDAMIRRRALDEQSEVVVACALKNLPIPAGTLPPVAASVGGSNVMRPWLPTLDVRSELALRSLERSFDEARQVSLGSVDPLDRLKALDAVRRSLIVAVGRNDKDVKMRAMDLINYLGATDGSGLGITGADCASLVALDAALDTKVRPLEYWLAIHHFERQWLCQQRRAMLGRNRCPRVA